VGLSTISCSSSSTTANCDLCRSVFVSSVSSLVRLNLMLSPCLTSVCVCLIRLRLPVLSASVCSDSVCLSYLRLSVRMRLSGLPRSSDADPASCTTIPVASPHKLAQGKRRKLMEPAPWMQFHPFVATLEQWALGVSALCGEPWLEAAIWAAIKRGPHASALMPEARDLINKEMQYQIQAGFSDMVMWSSVQHAFQVNLKVTAKLSRSPTVGLIILKSSHTTREQTGTAQLGGPSTISPTS
jgi:hypothetical protein